MKSVDYIISAKHYGGSAKKYILKQQDILKRRRGITVQIRGLDAPPTGHPVYARVWQGQWIADCECGGACFVDPDEPIFFCFGCLNRKNSEKIRPVVFPEHWREIEKVLLLRPVDDAAGLTDLERAGMAKSIIHTEDGKPLSRSWNPNETLDDLHEQQDALIERWNNGI